MYICYSNPIFGEFNRSTLYDSILLKCVKNIFTCL